MSLLRRISNLWRRKVGSTWFYPLNASIFTDVDPIQAYTQIPEVNTVVNMKANAFSNALFEEEERTAEGQAVLQMLNAPNWYQSGREFLFQTKIFQELFGNEFIYVLRPVGLRTMKAWYSLPPNLVKVEYTAKNVPFFLFDTPQVRYMYRSGDGSWRELDRESVIHMAGARVEYNSFNDDANLMGVSPLKALRANINNIRMAYETRGVFLRHRGAFGILSNESRDAIGSPFPIDPKERERIQEEYLKYGSLEGQYQIIITNQPVKWQQIAVSPDKLGLFQEVHEDFNRILDAYGVPGDLFVRQQGSTYENQRQAELGFYVRTIIPEMNEWLNGINATFGTRITASFKHLPVFADEATKKNKALLDAVNALSRMLADGVITVQEYRQRVEEYLN